jgi:superfamily II DNA or RNA helicase
MPVVSLPESLTAELRPAAPIVLAATPTGVGKTHEALRALARHGTRAVFATPTHELAM